MSPIVAYHATRKCCRDSIRERGILPARPTMPQLFGVYVFRDDDSVNHPTWSGLRGNAKAVPSRILWAPARVEDLWQVAYIGPLAPDQFVTNGLVLFEPVKPSEVTLVTCN